MKKILCIILTLVLAFSIANTFASDISSGLFGTEYLEGTKELELTWDINEDSYFELYVYNHSAEALKIEINKGTRNIYSREVDPKQTTTIYGEGKFNKATYTIKAISLGTENLNGKLSYQITNNEDNLQKKIPDNLTDMSNMENRGQSTSDTPAIIMRPIDGNANTGFKPIVKGEKLIPTENIIVLEPSPQTKAVDELFKYGIMKGDPDGNLRSGDAVTRAEAVVLLTRLCEDYSNILKESIFESPFDDVINHWAAPEILYAYKNNLIDGTSGTTFEPERNVTVQEFAKMLVTLLGYKEPSERRGGFPNGYFVTASSLGLMDNLNTPITENALRMDVALVIANSLDIPHMKQSGFGENSEYIVMDGKNDTSLETFRTILESR